ncbi:hypothetical protein LINBF2_13130 [Limnohabitans sp. INBF002]|nr:hypothetical protein LINBF2_13130 [Limnohabitans sp. INBF002]
MAPAQVWAALVLKMSKPLLVTVLLARLPNSRVPKAVWLYWGAPDETVVVVFERVTPPVKVLVPVRVTLVVV